MTVEGEGVHFPSIPSPLTKQSAYDHICACLAIQKTASMRDGVCAYRGDRGRRCAIGHCIPQVEYSPSFEVTPTNSVTHVMRAVGFPGEVEQLLRMCQRAHDVQWAGNSETLRKELAKAATVNGVTPGAEKAITVWM